ncbi:MAG TPA: 1-pyrroline-5-carboxylate dehydrogenase [Lentisphaeria bacterium]|nr:MAG: 1-pyrroline-5-carboxylate dehydrogenase [Lentisphaerae bacterium GWF2_38_69]HBM17455.1 1-pyrroline-5-carboxylate dehydrogenase [Lentisphaeria bacterium]
MANGIFVPPPPKNETVKSYAPGSIERKLQKQALDEICSSQIDIPVIIGGKEYRTNQTAELKSPSNHSRKLGHYHIASPELVELAIETSLKAREKWAALPWQERAAIFLKAAEMISSSWRYKLNAATMIGQGKTVYQAEIDAACELTDFLNFNVKYMHEIYSEQPPISPKGVWNRLEYLPLEGFVVAITPFNFTAIAGNLPTSPAMLGNVILWKPASTSILSSYYFMKLLMDAGLPDGVINFIPCSGATLSKVAIEHVSMAGVHFTGSTETFGHIWKTIGENIRKYWIYPRLVGETGGKDFLIAHNDCDIQALATACVRGAFEYQGQKCSALSRAYFPKSQWNEIWTAMLKMIKEIKMGDVTDFTNFMSAVIDKNSFANIKSYIDFARDASDAEILCGGNYDDSKGYYIEPTVILTSNPRFKTMAEEIFGPVLTCYIYDDEKLDETLTLIDKTSPYALTGAIFAKNRNVINKMARALEHAAGNFYINDKPTGAVVGQQPFGGSRASGTNDKAGSKINLLRWVTIRTLKETFEPPVDFRYPHMKEEV